MKLPIASLLFCLICGSTSITAGDKHDSARAEFDAVVEQYEEEGVSAKLTERFFDLAIRHRSNPVAAEAYAWILKSRRTKDDAARAIDLLHKHHLLDPNLKDLCHPVAKVPSPKAEQLLRALIQSNPSETVRAHACLQLALLLEQQVATLQQLSDNPQLRQRAAQYYGKHVVDQPLENVTAKLERVYERMADSFGSATVDGEPLGERA